eukprot:9128845-Pyramimonas_sp.AAC.1
MLRIHGANPLTQLPSCLPVSASHPFRATVAHAGRTCTPVDGQAEASAELRFTRGSLLTASDGRPRHAHRQRAPHGPPTDRS